jgi:outer membrane receptor protein involved in Fe transport
LISADGSRLGGAFYGQIDHQLIQSIKLIAGFQTNKIGSLALDTVPRGGVIWTPTSWSSVKVLYGKAFRAPALDETLLNRPGVEGNPNLLPEKVGTFNLGFGVQGKRVEGEIDYFHSKQTDSIFTVPGSPARYENVGEITFDGMEAETKYYIQKDFFVQGSLLYQTNRNGSGVTNITPIPNFGVKLGASYESRNGLTISLFDVSDGAITGYEGSVNPLQGSHNVLNGQFRYDLSKHLPFGDRTKVALVAHGNNITNRPIWLPSWGNNSVDTVPYQQGRVIYAGLEFLLGKN